MRETGVTRDPRGVGYALLRVTLGTVFLFYGVGKLLLGVGTFAAGLRERFAESALPGGLAAAWGHVLPFLEVGTGILLVLGLFTRAGLVLAGGLLVVLTFGTVMEPDPPTVAHNVQFALVVFVLLWAVDHNGYSLDRIRRPGGGVGGGA